MLYVFKRNMRDVYSWYVWCVTYMYTCGSYVCVVMFHLYMCGTLWHVMCYVYVVLVYVKCGTYRYMIYVVFVVWVTLVYGVHLCVLWYGMVCTHGLCTRVYTH